MKFRFEADFDFEANDIDEATAKLALHFLNLMNEYIEDPLEFEGTMEINRIPDAPKK